MELEGCSWPTCSKQPRLVDRRIGVVNNDDEFCWQRDRLAAVKISKSEVWDKVPEASTQIFGDTQIYLQRSVEEVEGSLHVKNQLDSSSRFDTTPACDGRTDGHTMTANIALA